MRHLSFVAALLVAGAAPALAWDPAKAGRYGGLDLDKLDVGGQVLLRGRSMVGNGCASTDGGYATDGTQSWQPTCFGTFLSPNQDVRVFPTRGTPKGADGNPVDTFKAVTGNLIQFQADGAIKRESNGQFINMDSVGGGVSAAELDTTNAVGQLISIRQRPGPNGEKPPTTWGHNIDFHIAPGAGNVQSYGVEYDMNNFNKDCAPGSGCLSAAMFFNGIGSPNTAWLYSGGGTTNQYSGTVSVNNGVITWLSGTDGKQFNPTFYNLVINGTFYRAHYVSPTQMIADVAIPNMASGNYTTKSAMTHFGVFFQGDNSSSDADIFFATNAYDGIRIAGNHHVAFNASGDTGPYALATRPGQAVCLNGFQSCFYYDTGAAGLRYGANLLLGDNGNITLGGGLLANNITTNGLNSAPYTPASSSATCTTGDWAHDANYVYTCASANSWKRAALSSW